MLSASMLSVTMLSVAAPFSSLNRSKAENRELKEAVSKWEETELVRVETETSRADNLSETLLQRIPRNFLSRFHSYKPFSYRPVIIGQNKLECSYLPSLFSHDYKESYEST